MKERFAFALFAVGIACGGLSGLAVLLAFVASAAVPALASSVADSIFLVGTVAMFGGMGLALLGWQLEKRRKP